MTVNGNLHVRGLEEGLSNNELEYLSKLHIFKFFKF